MICEISTTPIKDTLKNLTIDDKKIVCEKNEKRSNFEALIANFQLLCHDLGGVISQKREGVISQIVQKNNVHKRLG